MSFGTFIFAESGVQSKSPESCRAPRPPPRSPSLPGCLRSHPPSLSFLRLISPFPPISFPSFFTSVSALSARDALRYGSFLQEALALLCPQPAEPGSLTAGPEAGKEGGRSRQQTAAGLVVCGQGGGFRERRQYIRANVPPQVDRGLCSLQRSPGQALGRRKAASAVRARNLFLGSSQGGGIFKVEIAGSFTQSGYPFPTPHSCAQPSRTEVLGARPLERQLRHHLGSH